MLEKVEVVGKSRSVAEKAEKGLRQLISSKVDSFRLMSTRIEYSRLVSSKKQSVLEKVEVVGKSRSVAEKAEKGLRQLISSKFDLCRVK